MTLPASAVHVVSANTFECFSNLKDFLPSFRDEYDDADFFKSLSVKKCYLGFVEAFQT